MANVKNQNIEYLGKVLDSLSDEIVLLDGEGNIIFANKSWQDFSLDDNGNGGKTGISVNYLNVCDSAEGEFSEGADIVAEGIREVLDGTREFFRFEYPCPDAGGYTQWYEMKVNRLTNHEPVQLVVTHTLITKRKEYEFELTEYKKSLEQTVASRTRDLMTAIEKQGSEIEKRKQTESELRKSRKQIRNFSKQLNSSIERERQEIAREIHDELGQTLTALKLDISWLHRHVSNKNSKVEERFTGAIELLTSTISTVKDVLKKLRPSLLHEMGLGPAIEWQAKSLAKRTGLQVDVDYGVEKNLLTDEASIIIYRIIQEAMTNVAKHGNAKNLRIYLSQDGKKLKLSVSDDGVGISDRELAKPSAFGLTGIKERVRILGGKVEIFSSKDIGTTIKANFPLNKLRIS